MFFAPHRFIFIICTGTKTTFRTRTQQINGTSAHKSVDNNTYSARKSVLCGISVFCERYNLAGKIDIFNIASGELCERKKHVTTVYDGYVFQLYGQYFSLKEMGYSVKSLVIRSMDNNKTYPVSLPESDTEMLVKFRNTIDEINSFNLLLFKQTNRKKCELCIYEPLCDSSLL